MTPSLFRFSLAAAVVAVALAPATAAPAPRPNIVLILADDLGWRDLRCYGSEIHDTPNLDRLAAQGMRVTQAYAGAPICSASRAALLTGRSPARLNFEFVTKPEPGRQQMKLPLQSPPFTLDLPLQEITFAEPIGAAGYATALFVKWHLNRHVGGYLGWSSTHGPLQQGFKDGDQEFGSHPYGDAARTAAENAAEIKNGDYGRDALTERAIGFLEKNRDRPFLLELSHYYVHTPIRTRAKWLEEKYAANLPAGAARSRAAYGAMVETLDHLVGRVLRKLDELELTERTLVVFMSDNGGHPEFAANGPLRGSKWNVYEGGIRVPLIVRWPGHVRAGSVTNTPVINTDLFPTFCEVAGAKLPAGVTFDGESLADLLRGKGTENGSRALVWHFPYYHPEAQFAEKPDRVGINDFAISQTRPQSAIRKGDYKLVHFYENDRDELYRLSADVSEQNDLAAREPEKTRELRRELDEYLRKVRARLPQRAAHAN
jgi:uncharacterized sulfatase